MTSIKMSKVFLFALSAGSSLIAQAFAWPQPGSGTTEVTIPAGEVAVVEEADVAAVEALTKITLGSATSGIKFLNTSPLTLTAAIDSPGAGENNGDPAAIEMVETTGKVTFNGDVSFPACRNFILGNCVVNGTFGSARTSKYGTFYVLPGCLADFTATAKIVREYNQNFATSGSTGSGAFRFACTVPYGNTAGISFAPCTIICAEGFKLNQRDALTLSGGGFGNLCLDLDGRDRTFNNISGGSAKAESSNPHCWEFTSTTPATAKLTGMTTRTTSLCVTGQASLEYESDGVLTLVNGVTETTGSICLSQGGFTFGGNAQIKRAVVNVSGGVLKADVGTAFGDGADIVISGTGVLNIPEGVTVTPKSLTINGTVVDLRKKPTMVDLAKTFPDNVAGAGTVAAACDFYVDADKGADEGRDGFSEATAFKTLEKACAEATIPGSRIIVLPGVYAEGGGGSRASVHAGVALVSRDGADVTVIEGEAGMRCVSLASGSRIDGFTLRKGDVAGSGGGVYGADATTLVIGCIISNCTATGAGGGACNGNYLNCRVSDVYSSVGYGHGIRAGNAYGCVFYGLQDSVDSAPKGVYGCTFINPNTWGSRCLRATTKAVNCVFKGSGHMSNTTTAWEGCVFTTAPDTGTPTGCIVTNTTGIALDAEGRPLKDSPVVDFGNFDAYVTAAKAAGFTDDDLAKDAFGGQRRYNRALDAGACEYDWCDDYAAALGGHAVVDEASGGVYLNESGFVCLGEDGAFLRVRRDGKGGFFVTAVHSVGAVSSFVDGVQTQSVDAPGGTLSVVLAPGQNAKLVYAGSTESVLGGFKSNSGLILLLR